MNKGVVIGGAVAALAAVYLGGVYYTSQQADDYFQQVAEQSQQALGADGSVEYQGSSSLFAGQYHFTYTLPTLPDEFKEALGGDQVAVITTTSHGFLQAESVTRLAPGQLRNQLMAYQADKEGEPIVVVTSHGFSPFSQAVSTDAEIKTQRFTVQEGDEEVIIGALDVQYEQNGRDFEVELEMEDSSLKTPEAQIEIKGVSGTESGELNNENLGEALIATNLEGVFEIEEINTRLEEGTSFLANDLKLEVEQKQELPRMLTRVNYKAGKFTLTEAGKPEKAFEKPNFELVMDMDYQGLYGLLERFNQMNQEVSAGQEPDMEQVMAAADQLSLQGVGLDITDLSVELEGHKAQGRAELDLAPFKVSEVLGFPPSVLEYVTLDARFKMPVAMEEALLSGSEQPGAIQQAVEADFMMKKGDNYEAELTIKDGEVSLNGKPVM